MNSRRPHRLLAVLIVALGAGSVFAQPQLHKGLVHAPAGAAQLSVQGGDLLVAPMLSPSDGVSIALGQADGHRVVFAPGLPLQTGDVLQHEMFGTVNGNPNIHLQKLEITGNGGVHTVRIGRSPVAVTMIRVDVYAARQLVSSLCVPPSLIDSASATFFAEGCVIDVCTYIPPEMKTIIDLDLPGGIDVLGQPPVVGDRIVFTTTYAASIDELSAVRMAGRVPGGLQIKGESINLFGAGIESLANVAMLPNQNGLALGPFNGSGAGGIGVGLGLADAAMLRLAPSPKNLPNFASMRLAVRGVVGGAPDQSLGSVQVCNLELLGNDRYVIDASFGSQGANVANVLVFDDGSLVSQQTLPLGVLGFTDLFPVCFGKLGGIHGRPWWATASRTTTPSS